MEVYLASSWRNELYESVLDWLIYDGFEVYNFKDPKHHSHWSDINPNWKNWTPRESIDVINKNRKCDLAFQHDFSALVHCDALVLLNPCGKSAHLEAGFAIGAKKPVFIYKHNGDPELMYRMADGVFDNLSDLIDALKKLEG